MELICYQCEQKAAYLFEDSRCKHCTHLTPEEVAGEYISEDDSDDDAF